MRPKRLHENASVEARCHALRGVVVALVTVSGSSGDISDANGQAVTSTPPAFRLEIRKSGFKRKAPSDFRSGAELQLERRSLAGSDHRAGRWPKFSAVEF